ncbi:hypothetical protein ABZ401_21770 [Streptomyces sp. NPDC005892]|uniref:hypothetical protein n=1 Tax=Streptomyces sp. NPDC005892 TaxID=3155593 RepID=UPI0033CB0B44
MPASGSGHGGPVFTARRAGTAWLLATAGPADPRALEFTARIAPDTACTVLVVDLPDGADGAILDRLARVVPAGTGGLRLVFARPPLQGAVAVARYLAEHLGRTVIAAEGIPLPTPGGGLHIGPEQGPGWVRCVPGAPEVPDSRAFPKPEWEPVVPPGPRSLGRSVVEPVPAGVWLRPAGEYPDLDLHRTRLTSGIAVSADLLTVAVGTPAGPAPSVADIARFWQSLPPASRSAVRFLCYGPARLSGGRHLGDVLAQAVGEPVRFHGGMVQGSGDDDVLLVGADGSPGRPLWAHEFVHVPPAEFPGPPPVPYAAVHRWPLDGLPEIRPGVHRLAEDVLVEVVRSGLWIRPSPAPVHAPQVRDADPDPERERVLCDAGSAEELPRLQRLARELVRSFSPELRDRVRLGVCRPTPPSRRVDRPGAWPPAATGAAGQLGVESRAARLLGAHPELADGEPDPAAALAAVLRRLAGHGVPDGPGTHADGRTAPHPPPDPGLLDRGLRMLPVHRGPTGLRATLDERTRRWYEGRAAVTDPDACEASTLGPADVPGNTDVLIWSVNGRRTGLLDPDGPDRVLFLPGTRFRVVGHDTTPGLLMMRETVPGEPAADDDLDRAAARDLRAWREWLSRPRT